MVALDAPAACFGFQHVFTSCVSSLCSSQTVTFDTWEHAADYLATFTSVYVSSLSMAHDTFVLLQMLPHGGPPDLHRCDPHRCNEFHLFKPLHCSFKFHMSALLIVLCTTPCTNTVPYIAYHECPFSYESRCAAAGPHAAYYLPHSIYFCGCPKRKRDSTPLLGFFLDNQY